MLPSIKVALPLLMILWAVGAWWADMWPLLLYPAMWAAVGLLFLGIHATTGAKQSAGATTKG